MLIDNTVGIIRDRNRPEHQAVRWLRDRDRGNGHTIPKQSGAATGGFIVFWRLVVIWCGHVHTIMAWHFCTHLRAHVTGQRRRFKAKG